MAPTNEVTHLLFNIHEQSLIIYFDSKTAGKHNQSDNRTSYETKYFRRC